MKQQITLTTLVENSVHARGLRAEHGLSFHLQVGSRSVLFDTGQSDLLLRNALKLRISLANTEAVVLSHGHNDHTGGVSSAWQAAPRARLFLHPAALSPKFARNSDGSTRAIGMDEKTAEEIRSVPNNVIWTAKPTEVLEGIFASGEIPRQTTFEDTGGPFYLDPAAAQPDLLLDDQSLFFDTANGVVVLLGCAHSGVVNTLEYIGQLTGNRPISALLGGMHLAAASPDRVGKIMAALRRLGIQLLAPAHCTGIPAASHMWNAFPGRCTTCAVGTTMRFLR